MEPEGKRGIVSPRPRQRSLAFLIRCWQEPDSGLSERPGWRFSLTHINKYRKKIGFTDLEEVMAYLHQELEGDEESQLAGILDRDSSQGDKNT